MFCALREIGTLQGGDFSKKKKCKFSDKNGTRFVEYAIWEQ